MADNTMASYAYPRYAYPRYAYPAAYYAVALDYFQMEAHRHDQWEIMYLVTGTCRVEVEGVLVEMEERQFICIRPGIPHRLEINQGEHSVLLNYEFSCLDKMGGTDLNSLAEKDAGFAELMVSPEPYLLLTDYGKMEYVLKDLISELERRDRNSYLLDLIFQRMLIEWSRCIQDNEGVTGMVHLKKARKYIREHFREDIRVEDVAKYVSLNHSYLQTLFSKAYGCGIMEYINNQRLERAQFLLKNSSMNIVDIAFEAGFNSRQHFGYTFQKKYRLSPKQYRKLKGQNIAADTGKWQKSLRENGEAAGANRLV